MLMGRLPAQGGSLIVNLDKLAETLAHAKACERLEEAVNAIIGPVPNERVLSLSREGQGEQLWQTSISRLEG